jgi:ComF family protein
VPYAQPLLQTLIHSWKYDSLELLTPVLAEFVFRTIQNERKKIRHKTSKFIADGLGAHELKQLPVAPPLLSGEPCLLAPIPLHPKREKLRGFNQAHLLAHALAQYNPHWKTVNVLSRIRHTQAQATLSGIDRMINLKQAFKLEASAVHMARGRHVVLVDDVITTGSTANTAALLLKSIGTKSVHALSIAYGHAVRL